MATGAGRIEATGTETVQAGEAAGVRRLVCPADAFALFAPLADAPREQVAVAYLDGAGRLLGMEAQPPAARDRAPLLPAPWLRTALLRGATGLLVAHNHPGGDPAPSLADIHATRHLAAAAQAVGVRLVDHVVVARSGGVSLRGLGLI